MPRSLLAIAAVLALGAGLAIGASPEAPIALTAGTQTGPHLSRLLGLAGGTDGGRLVRLDPHTLRPLRGTQIAIGPGGCASQGGGTACWAPAWAVSPDGKRLVLAESVARGLRDSTALRVVDPAAMRTIERIPVPGDAIGAVAWLRPGRVLAVQEATGGGQRVVAVDLAHRRVAGRQSLQGSVMRVATAGPELVVLVAPPNAVGPARIEVVDAEGVVRVARLDRIFAGSRLLPGGELRIDSRAPGLAVDPATRRAFVVAKGIAAEIDLRTLAVSYHGLDHEATFLSRLWSWLDPAALAKEFSGQRRDAGWLGNGLLAVSGTDEQRGDVRAAGLSVVDTKTWKVQTIDPGAMSFAIARNRLVATGGRWDQAANRETGIGLSVYGLDGKLRFRLFDGRQAWAQVVGDRAIVGLSGGQALRVVDLAHGAVTGMRGGDLPLPLLGSSGGRWGPG